MASLRTTVLTVAAGLFMNAPGLAQGPASAPNRYAKLKRIHVERVWAAGAVPGADLTFMTLQLWLPVIRGEPPGRLSQICFIVRLLDLEPVVDDTGSLLSPWGRLRALEELRRGVRPIAYTSIGRQTGPEMHLVLDAPARGAERLRSLRGRVEVTEAQIRHLRFPLADVLGKPLRHPDLQGLEVAIDMKRTDLGTEFELRVKGQQARIEDWGISRNDIRPLVKVGQSPIPGGVVLTKAYAGRIPQTETLHLDVAVPRKTTVVDFAFSDILLP